ncbi:MAG: cobalt ECF transporter T component CbiQ [Candidatus Freyarchaeota archaeon]|nr:cobalt ECF transporter T component CbiQ [Candidatus Freyrarchaeum guaymaensis]
MEAGFKEFLAFFREFLDVERFGEVNSPIHRLDPRVKIVVPLALIFSALLLDNIGCLLVLAGAIVALLFASRIPKTAFVSRTGAFTLFSVVVMLPVPFMSMGTPITFIQLPFVTLTPTFEGVYRAASFIIRVWVCIASALLLRFTTKFPEMAAGLKGLGVPSLLSSMLLLTYRYIFLFADEAFSMLQAKELRCVRREKFLERVRGVGRIAGNLLLRAYGRGEQVYYAMLLRGFSGGNYIPAKELKPLSKGDVCFAAAFVAFCSAVVALNKATLPFMAVPFPLFTLLILDVLSKWIILFSPFLGVFMVV